MDKEDNIENEITKIEVEGRRKEAEEKVREIEKEIDKLNKLDELSKKSLDNLTEEDKEWLSNSELWNEFQEKFLKFGRSWEEFVETEINKTKNTITTSARSMLSEGDRYLRQGDSVIEINPKIALEYYDLAKKFYEKAGANLPESEREIINDAIRVIEDKIEMCHQIIKTKHFETPSERTYPSYKIPKSIKTPYEKPEEKIWYCPYCAEKGKKIKVVPRLTEQGYQYICNNGHRILENELLTEEEVKKIITQRKKEESLAVRGEEMIETKKSKEEGVTPYEPPVNEKRKKKNWGWPHIPIPKWKRKEKPPKEPKPKKELRISWHEEPSEFWKPIAALVGIVFGGFLTATGNWIFGLPLLAAGLIILFTTEDLGEKLVNLFAYLKNHPKVSAPLGVIISSIVLFFIFGFWAAIVPPIAAGLFYAISKKRGGKGAEFFLEFIVSVIGVILFVGGVHYASVYLFISFDWRQLVAFGIGNSILLWLLWFMRMPKTEKEKIEINILPPPSTQPALQSHEEELRKQIEKQKEELEKLKVRERQQALPTHEGESQPILPPHKKRFREVVQCDKCGNIQDSNTGKLGDNYYVCSKCGKKFNAQPYLKKE